MQRILVLRGGALGDLIVTLPALALLREQWPTARIELIGNSRAAELATAAGLIDRAYSQDDSRWLGLFSAAPLPAALVQWLQPFDLVLNFWPDPDESLRARFPIRADQIFLQGSAHPQIAPAAAHFRAPLESFGVRGGALWFDLSAALRVIAEHARGMTRSPSAQRKIAVHPGSGSPRKNWPIERWTELCEWLRRERSESLLVVTGEAERPGLLAEYGREARQLPLLELSQALHACDLFIGHDSGISHLAAALRVPCLLLFGPTEPSVWAPPAPHVRVFKRGPDVAAISLTDVQEAVTTTLAGRT